MGGLDPSAAGANSKRNKAWHDECRLRASCHVCRGSYKTAQQRQKVASDGEIVQRHWPMAMLWNGCRLRLDQGDWVERLIIREPQE